MTCRQGRPRVSIPKAIATHINAASSVYSPRTIHFEGKGVHDSPFSSPQRRKSFPQCQDVPQPKERRVLHSGSKIRMIETCDSNEAEPFQSQSANFQGRWLLFAPISLNMILLDHVIFPTVIPDHAYIYTFLIAAMGSLYHLHKVESVISSLTPLCTSAVFILFTMLGDTRMQFATDSVTILVSLVMLCCFFLEQQEISCHQCAVQAYNTDIALIDFEKASILYRLRAHIPNRYLDRLPQTTLATRVPFSTVAFITFDNLVEYTETLPLQHGARLLAVLFDTCEEITEQYGCEKIKTFQNTFMIVSGLFLDPAESEDPEMSALVMCDLILSIRDVVHQLSRSARFESEFPNFDVSMCVGISCGPLIEGLIGSTRFSWDVWGDTVNTAARMENPKTAESHRIPGIRVSDSIYKSAKEEFEWAKSNHIHVKGKGSVQTYILLGRRTQPGQFQYQKKQNNRPPVFHEFVESSVQERWDMEYVSDSEARLFQGDYFRIAAVRTKQTVVLLMSSLCILQLYVFKAQPLVSQVLWTLPFFLMILNLVSLYTKSYTYGDHLCFSILTAASLFTASCLAGAGSWDGAFPVWARIEGLALLSIVLLRVFYRVWFPVWPPVAVYAFFSVVAQAQETALPQMWIVEILRGAAVAVTVFFIQESQRVWTRSWKTEKYLSDCQIKKQQDKDRYSSLLGNSIPPRFLEGVLFSPTRNIIQKHSGVVVLTADIANFTRIVEETHPLCLTEALSYLFVQFDTACEAFGIEKVRTIGDGYLACVGLHCETDQLSDRNDSQHDALHALHMATTMHTIANNFNHRHLLSQPIALRIGIAYGDVISGVLGNSKFQFDVFGKTVRVANQLEQEAWVGCSNISYRIKQLLDSADPSWAATLQVTPSEALIPTYHIQQCAQKGTTVHESEEKHTNNERLRSAADQNTKTVSIVSS